MSQRITAEQAAKETENTSIAFYHQSLVDNIINAAIWDIKSAINRKETSTQFKNAVFARIIGEPIETLVRRAEVISELKLLGFKCETTEQDIKNSTLTISW